MVYYKFIAVFVFLPLTMLFYKIIPAKYRWIVLLISSLGFYSTFSVKKLIFPFAAALITYAGGLWLARLEERAESAVKNATLPADADPSDAKALRREKAAIREAFRKKSRGVLTLGILLLVSFLLYLKYTNFFLENVNSILQSSGSAKQFPLKELLLPLGISFYTMQAIGYLVDVYWKKIPAQKNPFKLLLFLLFFPTIIEGPIAAYADINSSLYAGNDIDVQQIMKGFLRIGWGVMKKLVIADRLFPAVTVLYEMERDPHGAEVVAAAVLFTVMEYLDFSGCIDMALGYASIFGIRLPENFKRPFLAKNASEFWRRWHISLGVWFKTYIFYPMSMSLLAKKWGKFAKGKCAPHLTKMVASAMALLPVWLCNGLWHGPKWTYIFYGVFYFVVIMLELIFEPVGDKLLSLLHLEKENRFVTILRVLRTWFVIFLGELFFQAKSLKDAFVMLSNVPRDFHIRMLWDGEALHWGLDKADWLIVGLGLLCVIIVNILREKGKDVLQELANGPIALRWILASALIFVILIFGLYGPGYLEVDMIYAGF